MINDQWLVLTWTSNPCMIGAFERTARKKYNFLVTEILLYFTGVFEGFFNGVVLYCFVLVVFSFFHKSYYWFQKWKDQFKLSVTELFCVFSKVSLFSCSFCNSLLCTNTEALIPNISKTWLGKGVSIWLIDSLNDHSITWEWGNNCPTNIRS